MSTLSKKLSAFLFAGPAQVLASAPWKNNAAALYGFTADGTGYTVFKPASTFNSLSQLDPNGAYILDAATVGFELPGAALTAGGAGAAVPPLVLESFVHSYSQPYDNITLKFTSPDPADKEVMLLFDSPGAYSYKFALGNFTSLSVPNTTPGQVITLTAVAGSGARVTHTFTVGQ